MSGARSGDTKAVESGHFTTPYRATRRLLLWSALVFPEPVGFFGRVRAWFRGEDVSTEPIHSLTVAVNGEWRSLPCHVEPGDRVDNPHTRGGRPMRAATVVSFAREVTS